MKIATVTLPFLLSACLSSAKKGQASTDEHSANVVAVSIPNQGPDEFLFAECSVIHKNKRYIYNFYRKQSAPLTGSIYALEPSPLLPAPYYQTTYQYDDKELSVSFVDFADEWRIKIKRDSGAGQLLHKPSETTTQLRCEEFSM